MRFHSKISLPLQLAFRYLLRWFFNNPPLQEYAIDFGTLVHIWQVTNTDLGGCYMSIVKESP